MLKPIRDISYRKINVFLQKLNYISSVLQKYPRLWISHDEKSSPQSISVPFPLGMLHSLLPPSAVLLSAEVTPPLEFPDFIQQL